MSVEIRVRRIINGQTHDEVIEHHDTEAATYGYNLAEDNSFRVLEVEKTEARGRLPKVDVIRVYSAGGYLEVAGALMLNDMGTTPADLRMGFACDMGE